MIKNDHSKREKCGIYNAGKADFGRVLTTLRREEPDRVPVMELDVDHHIKEVFLGRTVSSVADDLEFWYCAGYDYIMQRPNYEFPGISLNAATGTPLRMEYQQTEQATTAYSEKSDRHVFTNEGEFEAFPWINPDTVDFSNLDFLERNMPDGMKMISGVGGIFTRSWTVMGFERFCMAVIDGDELALRIIERVADTQLRVLDRILNYTQVGAIWYGDDLAYAESTMLSPDFFKETLFPLMKKMVKMTHQRGLPFLFHSDGNISTLLDTLIDDVGIDAYHPWEPKAMDIGEGKRVYGDRLALIGNIDLSYTLPFGTEEEVEAEVRERIRTCGPGGGYAVGSSNTVTRNIPIENFRAMVNAAFACGTYPLKL